MSILVTGIFGKNFQKFFFEQLDYCKCFAVKNSALEQEFGPGSLLKLDSGRASATQTRKR